MLFTVFHVYHAQKAVLFKLFHVYHHLRGEMGSQPICQSELEMDSQQIFQIKLLNNVHCMRGGSDLGSSYSVTGYRQASDEHSAS